MRNIITIFSGRKNCLLLLNKYLNHLLNKNQIHEVHFWNYARNMEDEHFIKSISNLRRTSSSINAEYVEIYPVKTDDSFEFQVEASNDVHIKLQKGTIFYEVVLGGWGNTNSVIRRIDGLTDPEIVSFINKQGIVCADKQIPFTVRIQNGQLVVFRKSKLILASDVDAGFTFEKIYVKTGFGCTADFHYESVQNPFFLFFDTTSKTNWSEYYQYYTNSSYRDDVIVKCDDDIIFIDATKFQEYIKFVRSTQNDIVFANIINNGVSAYYQQTKYELIPKALDVYEYPEYGFCGSLWSSGKKADRLHDYFLKNHRLFLNYNYQKEEIPITTRFSINFFAMKGSSWNKIKNAGLGDDEYHLTEELPQLGILNNVLYSPFYVSHLSFGRQNAEFDTREETLDKYGKLFQILHTSREDQEEDSKDYDSDSVFSDTEEFTFVDVQKWRKVKPKKEIDQFLEQLLDSSFNLSPIIPVQKPTKIAFIESFLDNSVPWNGRTVRESKGVSGLHANMIYLAEYFASSSLYEVSFYSKGAVPETYRSVKYKNYNEVEEIPSDIVFITHNMQELELVFDKLQFSSKPPKIISLVKHPLINVSYLNFLKAQTMEVVYISQYVQDQCKKVSCPSLNYVSHVIPGCIDIYELSEVKHNKEDAFVFFAKPEKGFDIAKLILENFPYYKMYCNTYDDEGRIKFVTFDQIVCIDKTSSPRNTIYDTLAKSKYFVYPLYNESTRLMSMDTFAYVILEALLHGVVVVAPRMKVYEELYGDAIYYIDVDGDFDPTEHISAEIIEKSILALCELESNYFLYNSFIEKGLNLKRKFKKDVIGAMYENIFTSQATNHA